MKKGGTKKSLGTDRLIFLPNKNSYQIVEKSEDMPCWDVKWLGTGSLRVI